MTADRDRLNCAGLNTLATYEVRLATTPSAATFGLFSGTGFTEDLAIKAARSRGRSRILLVGLDTLYGPT